MHAGSLDAASLVARLRSDSAGSQEQQRSQEFAAAQLINRAGGVGPQGRLIFGGPAGVQVRAADPLCNLLASNILLTVVAGALLASVVLDYSRRTARLTARAKQVRRPEKEAADRRRRRQAGAAAEATQDGAERRWGRTNEAGAEVEAARRKAAKAEAAVLVAAEKAAAAGKAAEVAKAAVAVKAAAKVATKAAAEKAADAKAAKAAAAAEALDRPPPLPVMSLAAAQFDTGRQKVPESTIGGQTTCIVCFVNPKSHAAVPCGHQCACGDCASQMRECPVCRSPAREWMHVRVA